MLAVIAIPFALRESFVARSAFAYLFRATFPVALKPDSALKTGVMMFSWLWPVCLHVSDHRVEFGKCQMVEILAEQFAGQFLRLESASEKVNCVDSPSADIPAMTMDYQAVAFVD